MAGDAPDTRSRPSASPHEFEVPSGRVTGAPGWDRGGLREDERPGEAPLEVGGGGRGRHLAMEFRRTLGRFATGVTIDHDHASATRSTG